jgi:hypothetical protein
MKTEPFTVKWVHTDGAVTYLTADSLTAVPSNPIPDEAPGLGIMAPVGELRLNRQDDVVGSSINAGYVYIMNANGRTVEQFALYGLAQSEAA